MLNNFSSKMLKRQNVVQIILFNCVDAVVSAWHLLDSWLQLLRLAVSSVAILVLRSQPIAFPYFHGWFCLRIVGIHFGQELLQVFVFCNIPVLVALYRTSCEKMFPRLSFSVYRTARGRSDLIPCITLKNHLTRFNSWIFGPIVCFSPKKMTIWVY